MDIEDLTELPALTPPKELDRSLSVEVRATEQEVTETDLILANAAVNYVAEAWLHVKSIGGVCKLIDATVKATKHRRDLLQLPYGAPSNRTRTFDIANLE